VVPSVALVHPAADPAVYLGTDTTVASAKSSVHSGSLTAVRDGVDEHYELADVDHASSLKALTTP